MPSVCVQCNIALSIRIASPGNDGDVTQSNLAASSANAASSAGTAAYTAAQSAVPPLPASFPPPVPPLPVFSMPPIPPPPTVDVQRALAGVVPGVSAPAAATGDDLATQPGGASGAATTEHHSALRRHSRVQSATIMQVESRAFTRVVVEQRSTPVHARAARAKATAHGSGAALPPIPEQPRAPFAPSSPAAAGAFGSSGHGGGASVLTVSLTGALTFLTFALLSSILPATLPGRRRLSDDRRARPG